ncbi:MAG TPA: alpha/beta fold hydrolase [Steroidobacteraceae bacterium]|nr:alpha/beta fold hydrolase [Steroidobacteraceae bacterium]
MLRIIYTALAGVGTIYLAVCAAMFAFQRSLLYFPQPRMVTAAASTLRLRVPGSELIVTVRSHAGPKALIYFGGNAEDVSSSLEVFSRAFPEHALYLLHYRGYGGSTGSPSESANHADALAIFQEVHAQHPEVALIGRSLGSGVALRLASEVAAARLVLVTPFNSIEEIAAAEYPYLPVKWLLLDRYQSWKYAARIRIPTTLVAAENDEVIPRASADRLLARFPAGSASMAIIKGVGHNDIGAAGSYFPTLQNALR